MSNPAATNTISRKAYAPFLLGVLGATPNEFYRLETCGYPNGLLAKFVQTRRVAPEIVSLSLHILRYRLICFRYNTVIRLIKTLRILEFILVLFH